MSASNLHGYNPIVPPLPTFASTIRNQDRSSLACNRRSSSQYSSDEVRSSQEESGYKPTYSQLSDFEHLRRDKSTDLPVYRPAKNPSSFEIIRNKVSPWGSRVRSSPDLERGIDTPISRQHASPQYVDGRPVFPSLIGAQNNGNFRTRWRNKWRHWLGNQSRRRKIVLGLEIVLAGLIVGIIVGLSFGVIEDSVPRNKYYKKPEYLGHGGALK